MQCHNKEFCIFFQESLFTKAIENFPPVFLYPDINTLGVGKILDSNMLQSCIINIEPYTIF